MTPATTTAPASDAERHYNACVRVWGTHVHQCLQCKMAIETRRAFRELCEVGAACEDELKIAARRWAAQQVRTAA